jgi:hypothetical protein
MLFVNAHNIHWRNGERAAVCILKPKILPPKTRNVEEDGKQILVQDEDEVQLWFEVW